MNKLQCSLTPAISVRQRRGPHEFVFIASRSKPLDLYGSMQCYVDLRTFWKESDTPFAFEKTFWCNCSASTCESEFEEGSCSYIVYEVAFKTCLLKYCLLFSLHRINAKHFKLFFSWPHISLDSSSATRVIRILFRIQTKISWAEISDIRQNQLWKFGYIAVLGRRTVSNGN